MHRVRSGIVAGTLGGLLTIWVTFAPCFLWIFLGAPYVEALRGNKALSAALSSITAAAMLAILRLRVGMIPTLAACSAAGLALYVAGAIA
jgi:chromate transporter